LASITNTNVPCNLTALEQAQLNRVKKALDDWLNQKAYRPSMDGIIADLAEKLGVDKIISTVNKANQDIERIQTVIEFILWIEETIKTILTMILRCVQNIVTGVVLLPVLAIGAVTVPFTNYLKLGTQNFIDNATNRSITNADSTALANSIKSDPPDPSLAASYSTASSENKAALASANKSIKKY
jgi:hypothetical protein